MNTSSFDQLDLLQSTRPFGYNLANRTAPTISPVVSKPKQTKFGSVLKDLSSFLTTAADTAVTVDGVINGGKTNGGSSGLSPEQQMALMGARKSGGGMRSMLLIGGVVIVGGGLMYALLTKKS